MSQSDAAQERCADTDSRQVLPVCTYPLIWSTLLCLLYFSLYRLDFFFFQINNIYNHKTWAINLTNDYSSSRLSSSAILRSRSASCTVNRKSSETALVFSLYHGVLEPLTHKRAAL